MLANLLTGITTLVPAAQDKQEQPDASIYAPEWVGLIRLDQFQFGTFYTNKIFSK